MKSRNLFAFAGLSLAVAMVLASGCGNSASVATPSGDAPTSPSDPEAPVEPESPSEPGNQNCSGGSYESTFEAVQKVIFDRYECVGCHSGASANGGLDLSPEVAYANLIEVPSTGSNLARVYPGSRNRSSLWLKVYVHADPGVTDLAPMPPAGPVPTDDENELLRLWILGGAPETGVVLGTEELFPGCLADPVPQNIRPLEAPDRTEGVQFVMPGFDLYAASEAEVCFATYYDVSDEVPDQYKSEDGEAFYFDGWEVRQDAVSHHLIVFLPVADAGDLTPEDFPDWNCAGGPREGDACDPRDKEACGLKGICRTPVRKSLACGGYTPALTQQSLAVQQAQSAQTFYEGTYRQWPLEGIMLWNSHSFNLTTQDHILNGRFNLHFAEDRRFPQQEAGGFDTLFGIPKLLFEGTDPYTEQVLCERMVLPQGTRITAISSHTHSLGKHFWYELPGGEHIYDSYVYNDPLTMELEEPMAFDDPDPEQRTLTYCSLYRNGLDEDGNPLPEEVTRASKIEYPVPFGDSGIGLCEPIRCINQDMYDVDCDDGIDNNAGDDAACDSALGRGDGVCDACRITGGITTENEMFGAQVWYFIAPGFADEPVLFPDSISIPGIIGGGGRPSR